MERTWLLADKAGWDDVELNGLGGRDKRIELGLGRGGQKHWLE
jgi:hypothetical protein